MQIIYDYGFVVPLLKEAELLLSELVGEEVLQAQGRTIYRGVLGDRGVVFIISGTGKIRSASATQLLIDRYPAKHYVHFGCAGAICPSLKIGDVVRATSVIEHDVIELFPEKVEPPIHVVRAELPRAADKINDFVIEGPVISGDEDIVRSSRKDELWNIHRGLCVDWESAGFVLTCNMNGVSGVVYRAVSDLAHEATTTEYLTYQKAAVDNLSAVIRNILHLGPNTGTPRRPLS